MDAIKLTQALNELMTAYRANWKTLGKGYLPEGVENAKAQQMLEKAREDYPGVADQIEWVAKTHPDTGRQHPDYGFVIW